MNATLFKIVFLDKKFGMCSTTLYLNSIFITTLYLNGIFISNTNCKKKSETVKLQLVHNIFNFNIICIFFLCFW